MQERLGEKAEPLEDRAISELLPVADEEASVIGGRPCIGIEAICNVIDATSGLWHRQHVDQCARRIGNADAHRTTPDGLETE